MVMEAMPTEEIATEMHIKPRTVKAYLKKLYDKFGITDRYVKRVRLVHLVSRGGDK